ncbi:hypothetical protein [Brevundimonas sp.]|uniref:hypothetical protein n=1 Tax=Brevundimonas sp. TaxID=1871086 RepID=UPI0037850C25
MSSPLPDAGPESSGASHSFARRWGLRALYALGLLIYTVLFAEAFIRLVVHQPILPRYVTGTAWGVRGNIPDARFMQRTSEVSASFHFNSQGMRDDRTFPLVAPADRCRVALFGDSYFVGFELNLPDTYAYRLEQSLKARGYRVEVLNFAVSGFGTAEHNVTYEGYAKKFSPDVVIYEWHVTDFDDNVRSGLYKLENGRLERANKTYLPSIGLQDRLMKSSIYRFIADHSELYGFLRENAARYAKRILRAQSGNEADEANNSAALSAAVYAPASPYAISLSEALLEEAKGATTRDQSGFYVIEIPRPLSRTKVVTSINQMDADFLGTLNLIQPAPLLMANGHEDKKLYFEHGAQHLTPEGVAVLLAVSVDRIAADPNLQRCRN